MSETAPPGRPRSHRATGASRALGRLAAPLTALAVVVIVVVLLIWINGRSDDSSAPVAGPPTGSAAPPVTSPSPSRSPRPTSTPTKHRDTPVPAPHRSRHHASPSPSPSPSTAPFAPVEVLNNSRITGLAHHVAAEVQGRGWTISQIGNLRGKISETTVYFPAGDEAAAQHLQGEFGSIQRVLPQSEAGLDSTSLVLVVTRFWTD